MGRSTMLAVAVWVVLTLHARADYVVTSPERGVLRVSDDGAVQEVISATLASRGIRHGAHAMLFLRAASNELRELDLGTHVERVVASLPGDVGLGCGGVWGEHDAPAAAYEIADVMQYDNAMVADDARACFYVTDRNLNMASVIALIEVDLASGAVQSRVAFSETCGSLDDASIAADPCMRLMGVRRRMLSGGVPRRGAWSIDGAAVVGPRRIPIAIAEPHVESTSRDGHWAVVSGNDDAGDYAYRSLYLLDQRTGALRSLVVPDGAGAPWPAPIPRAVLTDADAMSALGTVLTGETSLAWIDRGRVLEIGGALIVRPGIGLIRLPGQLVL